MDKKLRQEQSGFRKGRGCIDHIFVLRNILDSAMSGRENYLVLYVIDKIKTHKSSGSLSNNIKSPFLMMAGTVT